MDSNIFFLKTTLTAPRIEPVSKRLEMKKEMVLVIVLGENKKCAKSLVLCSRRKVTSGKSVSKYNRCN